MWSRSQFVESAMFCIMLSKIFKRLISFPFELVFLWIVDWAIFSSKSDSWKIPNLYSLLSTYTIEPLDTRVIGSRNTRIVFYCSIERYWRYKVTVRIRNTRTHYSTDFLFQALPSRFTYTEKSGDRSFNINPSHYVHWMKLSADSTAIGRSLTGWLLASVRDIVVNNKLDLIVLVLFQALWSIWT